MMSHLIALITATTRAQTAQALNNQKPSPMTLLAPSQLRNVAGGDGSDSPKGSW